MTRIIMPSGVSFPSQFRATVWSDPPDRRTTDVKKGLFIRTIPVELVELSLSGCRLRTREALAVGAMGQLSVELGPNTNQDAVYVARSTPRPGAGATREIGGEFVWAGLPGRQPATSTRSIVPDV